jgi:hypothetical protein
MIRVPFFIIISVSYLISKSTLVSTRRSSHREGFNVYDDKILLKTITYNISNIKKICLYITNFIYLERISLSVKKMICATLVKKQAKNKPFIT